VNDHTLDPRLTTNSPALSTTVVAPNDGFYSQVSYKGAFDKKSLWVEKWTALDVLGYLPCETVVTPAAAAVIPPNPVTLTIARNGANVDISFTTQSGYSYKLQSKSPITGGWGDVGSPTAGTGDVVTLSQPVTGTDQYFQVVAQ